MKRLISVALAVISLSALATSSVVHASNRGKHIVGGFGSHHRGGHFVGHQTNRGMHIVGGHGPHHRGGHMVQ
jgi:hypothetical protein